MKKFILLIILTLTIITSTMTVTAFYTEKTVIIGDATTSSTDIGIGTVNDIGGGGWNSGTQFNIDGEPYANISLLMGNFPKYIKQIDFKISPLTRDPYADKFMLEGIHNLDVGLDGTESGLYFEFLDDDINELLMTGQINEADISPVAYEYYFISIEEILTSQNKTKSDWRNDEELVFTLNWDSGFIFNRPLPPNKTLNLLRIRLNLLPEFQEDYIHEKEMFFTITHFTRFLNRTELSLVTETIRVNFYNALELYASKDVARGTVIILPPTPVLQTEGLRFIGWRTKTGELITNLENLTLKTEWVTDGEINLSARYTSSTGEDFNFPNQETNAPEFITNLMDKIGINNIFGRFLVFFIIIAFITVGLLYIHANIFIFMTLYMAITILWLFLGFMPLFAGIIIMLLATVMFMLVLKGSGGNENG